MTTGPKYPDIRVESPRTSGSMLVSRAAAAMRRAGVPSGDLEEFGGISISPDYEDTLARVREWVTVK